jgi:hypothetical protein
MDERRKGQRDKVIFGGIASSPDGVTKDCVVRNISEYGARVEFRDGIRPPLDRMALTIARKGKSFVAKIIWLRDNIVGVAFTDPPVDATPQSDLEERLRKSEKKKRQLQRRIKELLGEG